MGLYNQVEEIVRRSGFGGMYLGVPAGQMLYGVMPGDFVKVKASVQYRGPKLSDSFYAAIGEWRGVTWPADIGYFDEIWHKSVAVEFASSTDWITYPLEVSIPITEIGLFPWTPGWFDLYAKLVSKNLVSTRYDNVIEVILEPEFQAFTIVSYEKIAGA